MTPSMIRSMADRYELYVDRRAAGQLREVAAVVERLYARAEKAEAHVVTLESAAGFVVRRAELATSDSLHDRIEALRKVLDGGSTSSQFWEELRAMRRHHALVAEEEAVKAGGTEPTENVHAARASRDRLFASKLTDLLAEYAPSDTSGTVKHHDDL